MSRRRQRDPDSEFLVRIFADFAETPVWYPSALNWEDLGLSDALRHDLDAFNDRRWAIEDPEDTYAVRASERRAYEAEGERLARELALDLGSPWTVVVLHPARGSGRRSFASTAAPRHPETATAFRALHDAEGWTVRS